MKWSAMVDLWRLLQASYWFVPTVMAVTSIILAITIGMVDSKLGANWLRDITFLFDNQPQGARALLTAIAGSMITVAGVTFSMTMVAVSSAASQFGPRLVGNFMRDTGNQITLGVFIATFVYCLCVLPTVRNASGVGTANELASFVPHLSILMALVLALACIGVLIYFIHHVPETINVANITANVGRKLKKDINTLFPDRIGVDLEKEESTFKPGEMLAIFSGGMQLRSRKDGYLVSIDTDCLIQLAIEGDFVIRLQYRPGDFVTEGQVILQCSKSLQDTDDTQRDRLLACFAIATERTADQNLLFLVDQLIEIMSRALSPGVNDPFTAINCMHWLTNALIEMSQRDTPSAMRYDKQKNLRLIAHPVSYARFCSVIFDQSIQYVATDYNASLQMLWMIGEAVLVTPSSERREILLGYAEKLESATSQQLPLRQFQEEIKARHRKILELSNDSGAVQQLRDDQGWLGGRA